MLCLTQNSGQARAAGRTCASASSDQLDIICPSRGLALIKFKYILSTNAFSVIESARGSQTRGKSASITLAKTYIS